MFLKNDFGNRFEYVFESVFKSLEVAASAEPTLSQQLVLRDRSTLEVL